jgi:DNA-binding MarR family transcriptional regulator
MNKAEAIQEILDNLRRVFQAINEYSRNAEKETGLTGPQLWAIKLLAETAPLRVSQLAEEMFLHPATVVGIIDRLEKKGLVIRIRSQEDRRAVDLHLTQAGKDMAAQAPEVAQSMLIHGLNLLSAAEFHSVGKGMKQMVRLLGVEHLTPRPLRG